MDTQECLIDFASCTFCTLMMLRSRAVVHDSYFYQKAQETDLTDFLKKETLSLGPLSYCMLNRAHL